VWSVPYALIWDDLRERWGAQFTAEERSPWDALGDARLVECNGCALHYFDPPMPGGSMYYEVLSRHPEYYVDDRWEFGVVLDTIRPGDTVVDFGSGEGAFLRGAAAVAGRVVGCDHNVGAAPTDVGGAELRHEPFDIVADAIAGGADVATSFHVLEHLANVDDLCLPATTALRAGGRLFLATPDRDRSVRNDLESLDCPPHHVSRWSARQYEVLADRYGYDLVSVRHEPFVHVHGVRRLVPKPLLHRAAIVRHRRRGFTVHGRDSVSAPPWPRGSALLAELVKRSGVRRRRLESI